MKIHAKVRQQEILMEDAILQFNMLPNKVVEMDGLFPMWQVIQV
jgi:hypothetical protein